MQNVLAKDAVFTTILRDPVTMYESLFSYGHFGSIYHLPEDRALDLFLEKPEFYYNTSHGSKCKARNPMLYDLGLEEAFLGDKLRIRSKIGQLRRELDLVMIMEYFEESLVLLKDLMCWDTDDMVYFVGGWRDSGEGRVLVPEVDR